MRWKMPLQRKLVGMRARIEVWIAVAWVDIPGWPCEWSHLLAAAGDPFIKTRGFEGRGER